MLGRSGYTPNLLNKHSPELLRGKFRSPATNFDQIWPESGHRSAELANVDQIWPNLVIIWPTYSDRIWSKSAVREGNLLKSCAHAEPGVKRERPFDNAAGLRRYPKLKAPATVILLVHRRRGEVDEIA